jgi:putative ABC transport system ATP-binding protein
MTASGASALVSVEHVRKSYRSAAGEQVVLDDLSLRVDEGELVVILGPSGCGKTTLLNILGALDRADGGSVRSCGVDLMRASAGELTGYRARSVGFIFQFYNLLPTLTALENVEAGVRVAGIDRAQSRRVGRAMLERVGLGGFEDRFPAQLSGGEQQRVAIARALANEPHVLLADEPTGNLDSETGAEIIDLLLGLSAEGTRTVVVVTHDVGVSARARRVIRMQDGRVLDSTAAAALAAGIRTGGPASAL